MKYYKRAITIFCILFYSSFFVHAQTHHWTRTNPGGGGAFSTIGASASGIIIAGSDLSGAYRSRDGGDSWDVIGVDKGLTETHVSGVGFHRIDGNVLYIGTEYGLFRSNNGGNSVVKVLEDGYITDIEFGTNNTNIGYATYHPMYNSNQGVIYKSDNNGLNWSQISTDLPMGLRLLKIIIDPTDVNTLYVLSGNGRFACGLADVFKSTDGGSHWINLTDDLPEVLDVALDPNTANNIFVTTMNASCDLEYYWDNLDGDLYKSTNGGLSWGSPLADDRTGVIWIDANNASLIRLVEPRQPYPWIDDAGTWTSINGGTTFTHTGYVDDWDTFYYDNAYFCYGSSFNGITKTIGEDLSNTNNLFWTNSQNVFRTNDGGTTFENLQTREVSPGFWQSRGFDNVNMSDIEISKADPAIIYLAYFDMGIWRSLDHGQSWQSCNHADYTGNWEGNGGNCATVLADPVRSNVVWASLSPNQDGETPTYLIKNTNTGQSDSWSIANAGLPLEDIMGLSLDVNSPTNNRVLFVTAAGDVYKSTNDGVNWSMAFDCDGCRFTAIDKFDSDIIYAGGEKGLWRSTNGGANWTDVSHADMPSTYGVWDSRYDGVFDVKIDPNNSNWVYVTALGAGKGLYRSIDRGNNWTKILTDEFMRKVAIMPRNSEILYATSSSAFEAGGYDSNSKGVLFSSDGGQSWTPQNEGMAYPFALAVEVENTDQPLVFVGSPGTGFQWSVVDLSTVAVDDLIPSKKVRLYPNPTTGQLHYTLPEGIEGHLVVTDLTGKVLHQQAINKQHALINITDLPSGVYLFSFQTNGFKTTEKVVFY